MGWTTLIFELTDVQTAISGSLINFSLVRAETSFFSDFAVDLWTLIQHEHGCLVTEMKQLAVTRSSHV